MFETWTDKSMDGIRDILEEALEDNDFQDGRNGYISFNGDRIEFEKWEFNEDEDRWGPSWTISAKITLSDFEFTEGRI